jgi:hypothetical protein
MTSPTIRSIDIGPPHAPGDRIGVERRRSRTGTSLVAIHRMRPIDAGGWLRVYSFHLSPEQARELADLLVQTADGVEPSESSDTGGT